MVAAIQLWSSNLILWSRTKGNKWNLNECAADVTAVIVIVNPDFRRLCWATDGWKYSLKHRTGSWLDYPMSWRAAKRKVTGKFLMVFTFRGGGQDERKPKELGQRRKRKYGSGESARNRSQRSIWVAVTLITHSSTYFTLLLTHQANKPSTKQGIRFDNQRSLVKRVKQSSLLKKFKLKYNGLRTQEWEKGGGLEA